MAMAAPAPEQPYMAPGAPMMRRHYAHRWHRRHYVHHRVHHVRHRMVHKAKMK
jgi:hypothetical protein